MQTLRPLFFLPLLLIGCATGTDPGNCAAIECQPVQYLLSIERPIDQRIQIEAQIARRGSPNASDNLLFGGEEIGTILFNRHSLFPQEHPSREGRFFYRMSVEPDSLVAPSGMENVWTIDGDRNVFPSFEGTILTPDHELVILPNAGFRNDSIFGDGPVTISWTPQPTDRLVNDFFSLRIDGGRISLTSPGDARDTTKGNAFVLPSDSLAAWRSRDAEISFLLEREYIRDYQLTNRKSARLVFREIIFSKLTIT